MKYKLKALFWLLLSTLSLIIICIVNLIFIPIYFIGAFVWSEKKFFHVTGLFYEYTDPESDKFKN